MYNLIITRSLGQVMSNRSKINIFLSTLNFVLCFVGYQLATSLFLPISSDLEGISRTVTVPYRAFALFISFQIIFLNIRRKLLFYFVTRKYKWKKIIFDLKSLLLLLFYYNHFWSYCNRYLYLFFICNLRLPPHIELFLQQYL